MFSIFQRISPSMSTWLEAVSTAERESIPGAIVDCTDTDRHIPAAARRLHETGSTRRTLVFLGPAKHRRAIQLGIRSSRYPSEKLALCETVANDEIAVLCVHDEDQIREFSGCLSDDAVIVVVHPDQIRVLRFRAGQRLAA